MKNKIYKTFAKSRCVMPLNLQLHAEGGDGAGEDNGGGSSGGAEGSNEVTFDDFLKSGEHQAEFDRRVSKAIQTAVSKAQEKWQALTDDKVSEADKLAKMNKDEKSQYLTAKKEQELSEREAAITRKELKAEAKNSLASNNLPVDLAEILDYTSADSCKTSMETVEKTFQKAVEAAVEEKLKGDRPPKKPNNNDNSLEQQVMSLMRGR